MENGRHSREKNYDFLPMPLRLLTAAEIIIANAGNVIKPIRINHPSRTAEWPTSDPEVFYKMQKYDSGVHGQRYFLQVCLEDIVMQSYIARTRGNMAPKVARLDPLTNEELDQDDADQVVTEYLIEDIFTKIDGTVMQKADQTLIDRRFDAMQLDFWR